MTDQRANTVPEKNLRVVAMMVDLGMPADCDFLKVARGEMTLAEMLAKEDA